jgi:hypothetical protein
MVVTLSHGINSLNQASTLARGLVLYYPMTTRFFNRDNVLNASYYPDLSGYRQLGYLQDNGNQFLTYLYNDKFGNAHNQDWSGGSITVLNSNTGGPTKPQFVTCSLHIKMDSFPHTVLHIAGNGQSGQDGWTAVAFDDGRLGFFLRTGLGQVNVTSSTGTIVTGVWYHLTFSFDGRYIRIYKDGVLTATNDLGSYTTLDFTGNTTYTTIGATGAFPNRDIRAKINHLTVHSRALSQNEIFRLYKKPESLLIKRPLYLSKSTQVAANNSNMFLTF